MDHDRYQEELIACGRDWLADCEWSNLEPDDFAIMSPEVIKAAIKRHYSGGWEQFARDSGLTPPADPVLTPHPRQRLSPLAC